MIESRMVHIANDVHARDWQILRIAAYLMTEHGGVDSPRWCHILADKLRLAAIDAETPTTRSGWMEAGV